MIYHSRLLTDIPGIRHAFLDAQHSAAFEHSRLVDIKQVHGAEIVQFISPLNERPQADGVFTSVAEQPVGIVTADCLPLLMASRDGQHIACIHAGWRGTAQGIAAKAVAAFADQGVAAEEIVAAVGPHIRPCCYEVSAGFYDELMKMPAAKLVADHRELFFSDSPLAPKAASAKAQQAGTRWFNLPEFCRQQMLAAGLPAGNIDIIAQCTYCTPQELGSYRRRTHFPAAKTQQISWIIKASQKSG
ncbi:peptidoglycan editing factor PgeF [Enterobacteriaceae bacterium 89]|nr:peptidoglycan editing factor PgeF [Enterobacteriaceae bacterium 89]